MDVRHSSAHWGRCAKRSSALNPRWRASRSIRNSASMRVTYDDVGGPKLVQVGCWAHARRKFVDAVKLNPQDAEAIAMVTRIDALFLIDRDARQRELSAEERLAQRRQHAEEWLTAIRETSLRLSREALPKSALGQAVTYTLNQWPKL